MKSFKPICRKTMIRYGALGVIGFLPMLAPNNVRAAEQPLPSPKPSMKELSSWRSTIMHVPRPNKGCFTAEYPKKEWHRVPCTKPPIVPFQPAQGQIPFLIGNGNDISAQVSGPSISTAIGSFDRVSGVVNEYGIDYNTNQLGPNIFSLQLNSNTFSGTSACDSHTECQGWAQFVYDNLAGQAYIQYWLLNYGLACPSGGPSGTGWMQSNGSCFGNSNAINITMNPPIDISQLSQMSVSGQAVANGNDTLTFYLGSNAYTTTETDTIVSLASYWNAAEFNIFGDAGGTEAYFNYQSPDIATIQVRIAVENGTTNAPTCKAAGTTGESNNLYFGGAPKNPSKGNTPAVVFTETSTNNCYTACQYAVSIGGTYLGALPGLSCVSGNRLFCA